MNILHSSRSDQWFTPVPLIESARAVLGTIDLDPASDVFGNSRVKALRYIDEEQCGLLSAWALGIPPISVFCNPPGGKVGNQSQTGLFWQKLMRFRSLNFLTHAIFLCFSAEALQSTQGKGVDPVAKFPFCIPAKRIRFDRPNNVANREAPSHSNVIVYVPGRIDVSQVFKKEFSQYGYVCNVGH